MGRLLASGVATALAILAACSAYEEASPVPASDASSEASSEASAEASAGDGAVPNGMVVVETAGGARFAIDATEVKVGAYKQFRDTQPFDGTLMPGACSFKTSFGPDPTCGFVDRDDFPVHCVDWCDAFAYCRSVGKRLCGRMGGGSLLPSEVNDPSKAQWVRACANGLDVDRWSYGNKLDPTACNTDTLEAGVLLPSGSLPRCEGGAPGVFDMSGNGYELEDNCEVLDGGSASDQCKLRGGAFNTANSDAKCNSTYEKSRMNTARAVSFRCCKDL